MGIIDDHHGKIIITIIVFLSLAIAAAIGLGIMYHKETQKTCPDCPECPFAGYDKNNDPEIADISNASCPVKNMHVIAKDKGMCIKPGSYVTTNALHCDMDLTGTYRIKPPVKITPIQNAIIDPKNLKSKVINNLKFHIKHLPDWNELKVDAVYMRDDVVKTKSWIFSAKEPPIAGYVIRIPKINYMYFYNPTTKGGDPGNSELFYENDKDEPFDLDKINIGQLFWDNEYKLHLFDGVLSETEAYRFMIELEKTSETIESTPTTSPITPAPTTSPITTTPEPTMSPINTSIGTNGESTPAPI